MKGNSKTMLSIFYLSQFIIRCWLYLKGERIVERKREQREAALSLFDVRIIVFYMNIAVSNKSISS